jgi:hypothetical protein
MDRTLIHQSAITERIELYSILMAEELNKLKIQGYKEFSTSNLMWELKRRKCKYYAVCNSFLLGSIGVFFNTEKMSERGFPLYSFIDASSFNYKDILPYMEGKLLGTSSIIKKTVITDQTCIKCGETKNIAYFIKSNSYKIGYSSVCKLCWRHPNRKYKLIDNTDNTIQINDNLHLKPNPMPQLILANMDDIKKALREVILELKSEEKALQTGDTLYSINQVRKRLGKAHKTISNLVKKGLLKTTIDGLISETAINEYLKKT